MIGSAVSVITLSMLKTILGVEFEPTFIRTIEWCLLVGGKHDLID